jgi:predicted dehydrogenase
MIRVGIVGCGYWGPNLIRCFSEGAGTAVEMVSDMQADRLAAIRRRYPGVRTTTDSRELIASPQIDAVAISTPVASHFGLATAALEAGKHVLVEKPMTATAESARRLIDAAERRRLVLMVDHTFIYTGAVRKVRELIAGGQLGKPYYYDSVRVNLGLFQRDVDVIWDLAVHDVSIMDYVLPLRPLAVSAIGVSHVAGRQADIAYVTVFCADDFLAHVHVNWLAPVKVRRTMIGGSNKMIVYDDVEPSEKVKVYDKGIAVGGPDSDKIVEMMINYRTGDVWIPKLDITEALKSAVAEFTSSVEQSRKPLTDGYAGLRTVTLLEMATRSMSEKGRPVELGAAMSLPA